MRTGYCLECHEERELRIEEREQTFDVRGEPTTVMADVAICTACGAEVSDLELDDRMLGKLYDVYRSRHNLLSSREIATLRRRWGLSQRALSRLLGWGPITIQRYEAGALQDNAHDAVLRQVEDHKFILDLLSRAGGRLSAKEQRLLRERAVSNRRDQVAYDLGQAVKNIVDPDSTAGVTGVERGFRPFDLDRFKQVTLWFARECPGLVKTKLAKLLWLADFAYFYENRLSLTGLAYARAPHGPMPDRFQLLLGVLEAEEVIELGEETVGPYTGEVVRAKEAPYMDDFQAEEIMTLKKVASLFGGESAAELSRRSHQERAWLERGNGEIIPYTEADALSVFKGFWGEE